MSSVTSDRRPARANSCQDKTIIKIEKRTHPFAQIDTRALNDARISWKAKGLHAYLLSKPPHWQVRFADLVKHGRDRAYSVRSALDELRKAGYAVLRSLKDNRGLFCGSSWTIYELPRRWSLTANGDDGFPNLRKTESRINGVSEKPNHSDNNTLSHNHTVSHKEYESRNSVPAASATVELKSGDSVFQGDQDQPIQNHIKYPEYAAWCRSQGGSPTAKGFPTWLSKQKKHWRNRVKQPFEQTGWVLDGKFYTPDEANELGKSNWELIEQFLPARNTQRQNSNHPCESEINE